MIYLKQKTALFVLLIFSITTNYIAQTDTTSNPLRDEVLSKTNQVEEGNNFTNLFSPDSTATLPIGIIKEIGTSRYIIAIDSAKFAPNGARFSAFMAVDFPGTTKKMCFAAKNIAFNPLGLGSSNTPERLMLVSDHYIKISEKVMLVLKGDGTNYVEWNCNGFQSINLKGNFIFSKSIIEPDKEVVPNDSVVTATFEVHANDIQNVVIVANISPFQIKGLKGFGFQVSNAVFDMSQLANAPSMTFPLGYPPTYIANPNMWTGFYLKQFTVRLPKEMSKKGGQRITISANNFVIDKAGVSGAFVVTNLLNNQDGSANGWAFSIDKIGIHIVTNNLNGGELGGTIVLPTADNDTLGYNALVTYNPVADDIDFDFAVRPRNNLEFNVFAAKVDLYPTSVIHIARINQRFVPNAILNGKIEVSNGNLKTCKLDFEQFSLHSQKPYFRGGIFSLTFNGSGGNNTSKGANYPISIDSITLKIINSNPEIAFNLKLNLKQSSDGNGFAAEARIFILAKINDVPDAGAVSSDGTPAMKGKWVFDRVKVNDIYLGVHTGPVDFDGAISFKDNDPVYGKAFFGKISITLKDILPGPIEINSCFGSKDTYRYFYVDAKLPIQITCGYITIHRMLGGLYYHMAPKPGISNATLTSGLRPTGSYNNAYNYVPDNNISIGFKAGATLALSTSDEPFNVDAVFEINFTSSGGLGMIKFTGDTYFFKSIPERDAIASPSQLPLYSHMEMQYTQADKTFHCLMQTYLNMNMIKGSYENGRAGDIVIHAEPGKWYVWVGTSDLPQSVKVFNAITASLYFMVGTEIKPMAPVPAQCLQIFNDNSLSSTRDASKITTAKGFATGMSISASASKSINLYIVEAYGSINAGIGFDFMFTDFGSNARCSETGDVIGINGWYAQGQAYAYLSGKVGIRGSYKFPSNCPTTERVLGVDINVPCLIDEGFDYEIMNVAAAALLQAKGPKPIVFDARIHCSFSFFGGAINDSFDYQYHYGDECSI